MSERPSVLLAVFAHPDDETFRCGGLLALLAQCGVQVYIITATRGEAGSCGEPQICTAEELAEVRERELICACNVLGIRPPIFLNYFDGKLDEVDEEEAVARIKAITRELRPQILLTWPADGLSDHPDHKAVSRWTSLVFEEMVKDAEAPIALYHLAVPQSVAAELNLSELHAIPDEKVSLTVDVMPVWKQKRTAIRCHRTQTGGSPILAATEEKQHIFFGTEHFRQVCSRDGDDWILKKLSNPEKIKTH
jgi:LmbE family N-acetylglucosaminyl deacetylase